MYRSQLAFALAMAALAAILLPSPLPAQITFQRTYGGTNEDGSRLVQQTTDGGYIIAGYSYSFGAGRDDIYLIKTNPEGATLWTRSFGGADYDFGCSVQQTADGGYIVAGSTHSFGAGDDDVYLIKAGADGDTEWTRTFGRTGSDGGNSVRQTADSGYIVAGSTTSFGAGEYDVYLVRTNARGDTQWTRTFGGTNDDYGCSVQQTANGGYIVTGYTQSFGGGAFDAYLIKVNAQGDSEWTRTYGGAGYDWGTSVQQTADSGYIMAGCTYSYGAGYGDARLVKVNASGDTLWTRTYGGADYDRNYSVWQTIDRGYVTAGYTKSFGAGGYDVYLIKTNADGGILWTRTFGGSGDDIGYSVQQTTDGGYVVAGATNSFGAGGPDVYLIKTDSLGDVAVAEPEANPTRAPALSLSCEPNPFAGTTTIHLTPFASRHSPLALRIYDAQGRAIRSFSSLLSPPSSLTWDGRDDRDQMLPSGAYFLRVEADAEHTTARVVLQR